MVLATCCPAGGTMGYTYVQNACKSFKLNLLIHDEADFSDD